MQSEQSQEQMAHLQNPGQKKKLKVKEDEFAYKGQEGKNRAILKSVSSNEGIDVQILFVSWRPEACCLFQYSVVPKISCPFLGDVRKHLLSSIKLRVFHKKA